MFTDERQVTLGSEKRWIPFCGIPYQSLAHGLRASYSRRQKCCDHLFFVLNPDAAKGEVLILTICRDNVEGFTLM